MIPKNCTQSSHLQQSWVHNPQSKHNRAVNMDLCIRTKVPSGECTGHSLTQWASTRQSFEKPLHTATQCEVDPPPAHPPPTLSKGTFLSHKPWIMLVHKHILSSTPHGSAYAVLEPREHRKRPPHYLSVGWFFQPIVHFCPCTPEFLWY